MNTAREDRRQPIADDGMPFAPTPLQPWQAYLVATVVTGATLGLRLAFDGPLGGRPTLVIFTMPIVFSAYMGGLRAGLLATGLSYAAASYYLLPPLHSFAIASNVDRWQQFFVVLAGVVISGLNEALHRARRRATIATREHQDAEATLREREEQLRLYVEHSPAAIAMFDRNMKYLVVSRRWLEAYRASGPSVIGRSHYEVFPEVPKRWMEIHQRCLAGAIEKCDEDLFPRADGIATWVHWEVRPWHQADRSVGGIIIFSEDITARKLAENARQESEARYRRLFEHAPDGIAITDATNKFVDANSSLCRLVGHTRDELVGRHASIIVVDKEISRGGGALGLLQSRPGSHDEWQLRRKDGSVFDAESHATLLPGGNLLAMIRDVTERKRAEAAMSESEQRFRTMADSIPQLAWVARADGHVYWYNQRWFAYTGTTPEQMEGWGWQSVHDPEVLPRVMETWQAAIASGKPLDMEFPLRGADGQFRTFLTRIAPLKDAEGRVVNWFGTNTDITERKCFEEALQATNAKLEIAKSEAEKANLAKSDFLSNMSHELRSPLNAILGFAQLMESSSPPPTESQTNSIAQILEAGWYLLRLISEILDLAVIEAGKLPLSPESVSLSKLISECRNMMEPQAQERGIRMTFPRIHQPLYVTADRTRLKQIVINLLSNAIKYNKAQGTVIVDCVLSGSAHVRVSVRDTGEGLSPEKLAQLFQPFNRLGQETGGVAGTGVGLVVSKRLAELMGGVIGGESILGKGSVFWFEMIAAEAPELADDSGEAKDLVQAEEPAGAPRRTLPYVEDNPANLQLVEQLTKPIKINEFMDTPSTAVDFTGNRLLKTTSAEPTL